MKFRNYIVILLVGAFLTSCINRHPKIGFLMHAYDSPRWENDEKYFVDAVKQLKGKALVREAGNDQDLQIKQARELISDGASVLVVIPVNQYAAARIVDLAHDNEIKVIA